MQKKELVNSVYPKAKNVALDIYTWIEKGKIILAGEQEGPFNYWTFMDHREEIN